MKYKMGVNGWLLCRIDTPRDPGVPEWEMVRCIVPSASCNTTCAAFETGQCLSGGIGGKAIKHEIKAYLHCCKREIILCGK